MRILKILAMVGSVCLVACASAVGDGRITDLSTGAKQGICEPGKPRVAEYMLGPVAPELAGLPCVFMPRGESSKSGSAFSFNLTAPATVYLCVHNRGKATLPEGWTKVASKSSWIAAGNKFEDTVYRKAFGGGKVAIPAHDGKEDNGAYGVPHLAVVKFNDAAVAPKVATAVKGDEIKVSDLSAGAKVGVAKADAPRVAEYKLVAVPVELENLTCIYMPRGDGKHEGMAYSFVIDRPAEVYLLVHNRGQAKLPEGWTKTALKTVWSASGNKFDDSVYRKAFPAGKVAIPAHGGKDGDSFGIPHTAVLK